MKKDSFYQLFLEQLKDIYSAEIQITEALPKMIKAASLPELKEAFKLHLQETKRQVQRLNKIFTHLGKTPSSKKCKGVEALIKEGEELINTYPASSIRDAALISSAQRIEHYEMASYGTVRAYARHMDLDDVVDFLQESLDEEGATNKKLTRLAEGGFFSKGINEEAQKEAGVAESKDTLHPIRKKQSITTRAKASTKRLISKTGIGKSTRGNKTVGKKTASKKTIGANATTKKVGTKATGKKTGKTLNASASRKTISSRKTSKVKAKPTQLTGRTTSRRRSSVTTSTPRVQIAARSARSSHKRSASSKI